MSPYTHSLQYNNITNQPMITLYYYTGIIKPALMSSPIGGGGGMLFCWKSYTVLVNPETFFIPKYPQGTLRTFFYPNKP